jgi:hypothetical protein
MAGRLGFTDHGEMFGQGIGDAWKVNFTNAGGNVDDADFGDQTFSGNATHYRGDNLAVPAIIEVFQFISHYRSTHEGGLEPSQNEIFEHLRKAGALPSGSGGLDNPFPEEDI